MTVILHNATPSVNLRSITEGRTKTRVAGLGTATTATAFSQVELLDRFRITDRRMRSIFLNGGIERRFLALPSSPEDGSIPFESQSALLNKHRENGIAIGSKALEQCVRNAGYSLDQVRMLCCVSTTGLLTPGLTAHLCQALDLPRDCCRVDIVGMGCNAGLNALNVVAAWSQAHPGELAVLCCIEVCSAAYVVDDTMRTTVVNSLFGDGSGALAIVSDSFESGRGCRIEKFASLLIPEALGAMRYDWDEKHGKFSFFLDRDIPYVIGANAESILSRLLSGAGLKQRDIKHWVMHTGGKKVIDSVKINLGLSNHDLRHTTSVLRDYGNVSSGSYIFTLERLLMEDVVNEGDYGVMMTMGPGSTIEMALVHW